LRAYELCSRSSHQTTSAFQISTFVLKCKKAKWDLREADRLRRRSPLLAELEKKLVRDKDADVDLLRKEVEAGEIGAVTFEEEAESLEATARETINDLRNTFAVGDPEYLTVRVSDQHDSLRQELSAANVYTRKYLST